MTVPSPAKPPAALPHPLTFFFSGNQRRDILRALRAIHRDRALALSIALGLHPPTRETTDAQKAHTAPRAIRRQPAAARAIRRR